MATPDHDKALLELHLRLGGGESPDDAVRFLVSRGISPLEARLHVRRLVSKSIEEQRRKGFVWLACAAVSFAIASPFVYAIYRSVAAVVPGRRLPRGFGASLVQIADLPACLLPFGLWLAYRGIRFVMARRYAWDPDR
jgi:hypothetical protein